MKYATPALYFQITKLKKLVKMNKVNMPLRSMALCFVLPLYPQRKFYPRHLEKVSWIEFYFVGIAIPGKFQMKGNDRSCACYLP